MQARFPTWALWLWLLLPSVAYASSFALVLYPFGALVAMVMSGFWLASGRKKSIRVASALVAALTATVIFLLPAEFYASSAFQALQRWLGEWVFFVLGILPASMMAFLVLHIGAHADARRDD